MVKIIFRKVRREILDSVDIRSLSLNEYRMLGALVSAASLSYRHGSKKKCVGSFDLSFIDCRVFAHPDNLNTLARLEKILCI